MSTSIATSSDTTITITAVKHKQQQQQQQQQPQSIISDDPIRASDCSSVDIGAPTAYTHTAEETNPHRLPSCASSSSSTHRNAAVPTTTTTAIRSRNSSSHVTSSASNTNNNPDGIRPPPPLNNKPSIRKRIKELFHRSSSSTCSFSTTTSRGSRKSQHQQHHKNSHGSNRKSNRRKRRISFSSFTESSIKSLGTIDLNHSNSILDDDEDAGLGLYAYDDIEKFHNCGGSCLSLTSLDGTTTASGSTAIKGVLGTRAMIALVEDEKKTESSSFTEQEDSVQKKSADDDHDLRVNAANMNSRNIDGTDNKDPHITRELMSSMSSLSCSGHEDNKEKEKLSTLVENEDSSMMKSCTDDDDGSCQKHHHQEENRQDHLHLNHKNNSAMSEKEMLCHRISELYMEGKKQLELGAYEKAWDIQMEALASISFHLSKGGTITVAARNSHDVSTTVTHSPASETREPVRLEPELESFLIRQDATIRYELAKIKYRQARESYHGWTGLISKSNGSSSHDNDNDQHHDNPDSNYQRYVSHLHDLVESARCRVALCNYKYYTSQLHAVEESNDYSDINQIYNKLYILHNLGAICEKDLHRYDEALMFYRHALDIEERVLRVYRDAQEGGGLEAGTKVLEAGKQNKRHQHLDDDTLAEIEFNVNDFHQRIRYTKRKIGRIQHTGMGRFDLALLSSVST